MPLKNKNRILLSFIFIVSALLAYFSTEHLKQTYDRWKYAPFYENQWQACEAVLRVK